MYTRPAVVALRDYLGVLVTTHPHLLARHQAELRFHVRGVVDELKAVGWPPERVIVAIKQIADDAGLHPSRHLLSATGPLSEPDAAIVHMVRWCIEYYYSADVATLS